MNTNKIISLIDYKNKKLLGRSYKDLSPEEQGIAEHYFFEGVEFGKDFAEVKKRHEKKINKLGLRVGDLIGS